MAFSIWIVSFLWTWTAHASLSTSQMDLVEYYAPVLYQHVGSDPKSDEITRFDFDGDLKGDNNWVNLPNHPTRAYVYFDLFETETHYFISYAFFHPRDYSYKCVPIVCHENDLEGIMLTIQKTSEPMGKLVLLETMAHDRIYSSLNPRVVRPPTAPGSPYSNPRVGIFSEWGGHGLYDMDSDTLVPKTVVFSDTWNRFFRKPQRYLYYYGAKAQSPSETGTAVASYELLRIKDTLWKSQTEKEKTGDYFQYGGTRYELGTLARALKGSVYGSNLANFPWAWFDKGDPRLKRGDWFLDPAFAVQRVLKSTQVSLKYKLNDYLGPNPVFRRADNEARPPENARDL